MYILQVKYLLLAKKKKKSAPYQTAINECRNLEIKTLFSVRKNSSFNYIHMVSCLYQLRVTVTVFCEFSGAGAWLCWMSQLFALVLPIAWVPIWSVSDCFHSHCCLPCILTLRGCVQQGLTAWSCHQSRGDENLDRPCSRWCSRWCLRSEQKPSLLPHAWHFPRWQVFWAPALGHGMLFLIFQRLPVCGSSFSIPWLF